MFKVLLLIITLGILSACCNHGELVIPKVEKPSNIVTAKDVEMARCICALSKHKLFSLIRNADRIDFTCQGGGRLWAWDDGFIEGCPK